MSKITFAIVGLGHIGKRYADLIQSRKDAKIVALIEINLDLHLALNKSYSCTVFSDIHDIVNQQEASEVVCLATPNYLQW